jgi:arylsulfatase A-like enzyme
MWTGYETLNPPSAERYQDAYIHTSEGSKTYEGRFGPDVYTDFLIDFMRQHREEPMLLYYPMALTHPPLVATPHEPDAEGMIGKHSAMVRYMDYLIGRLVDELDALGLRERTYVFFTTDNGTSQGIDGRMNGRNVPGGKGTLGENGMHAPFIVSKPGAVPAGTTTEALVDFTDLFPTFAELARLPLADSLELDGHSFAGVLHDPRDPGARDWVLSMGFGPAKLTEEGVVPIKPFTDRAVRDVRYKLWVEDGASSALYDLEADPAEATNLIASDEPAIAAARSKLEGIVASFPERDAAPRYNRLPPQPWDRALEE